ncbi:hypothetical protein B0T10DRAFT_464602 [Thelonectria olida]|uniref:Uncharacterized protein n=1 Tax=Thelonectria olida TaxID=1576542 RepID=A0A9P8VUI8_9HYPO|nr:hypothetical protein B0T10DRAFT_464602 [Thelonectria olida]
MKISSFAFALLASFVAAAPAPDGGLVARQCSCHKVGDEWICSGRLCPKDLSFESHTKRAKLNQPGCTCHQAGDEWVCAGKLCFRDFIPESHTKRQEVDQPECSCHKVGNEWVYGPGNKPTIDVKQVYTENNDWHGVRLSGTGTFADSVPYAPVELHRRYDDAYLDQNSTVDLSVYVLSLRAIIAPMRHSDPTPFWGFAFHSAR